MKAGIANARWSYIARPVFGRWRSRSSMNHASRCAPRWWLSRRGWTVWERKS